MSTDETVVQSSGKKRGRPKKVATDPTTPIGEYRIKEAEKARSAKEQNKIVESWYELKGYKLSLMKKRSSGSVFKTYIGSTNDKKEGQQVREFVKKLESDGRLKVKAL